MARMRAGDPTFDEDLESSLSVRLDINADDGHSSVTTLRRGPPRKARPDARNEDSEDSILDASVTVQ
ncbi:hypothetical protein AAVH_33474, partial [Aphelenchoides avenae]